MRKTEKERRGRKEVKTGKRYGKEEDLKNAEDFKAKILRNIMNSRSQSKDTRKLKFMDMKEKSDE